MATEGLVDSLEQLVWLLWESAWNNPLQFLLTFVLPLAGLAILCVGARVVPLLKPGTNWLTLLP